MKKEKAENILKKLFSLLMLLIVIIVTCFPFLMMFMGSFKEDYEIFSLSPKILPAAGFQIKMYRHAVCKLALCNQYDEQCYCRSLYNRTGLFFLHSSRIYLCKVSVPV